MGDEVRERDPALFERAGELVGEDPFARVEDSTRFAQPAIFCASLTAWEAAGPSPGPAAFAGHSLGEFAALASAGGLDRLDALALVVERGALMAEAEAGPPGSMLAVLKATIEAATSLAERHGLTVANDNAPGQVVLSGPTEAISEAAADAREQGCKAMDLGVTAAFHSAAMAPAAARLAESLGRTTFTEPLAPVWSGMTAAPFVDPARELADSLTHPVRWRELQLRLAAEGVERLVDCGPGQVLARLARRTLEDVPAQTLEEAAVVPV
jgi:malonyl CoA-acyl carrier protein transacylase